jgi:hypothetical protein
VQTCSTTADCSSLTQACDTTTGECGQNECGPDAGTAYYSSCDASGTDDGVCLPVTTGGRGGGTTTGVCLETGDAGPYAACSTSRGASDICGAGTYCVSIGGSSACMPLCTPSAGGGAFGGGGGGTTTDGGTSTLDAGPSAADGGGYSCSAGATCISETEIAALSGGGGGGGGGRGGGGGGVGVCLSSCSGGAACPGSLSCVTVPFGNVGSLCVP